jgi:glucose/arabinose dehydrogenase
MRTTTRLLIAGSATVAAACADPRQAVAQAPASPQPGFTSGVVRAQTVARGLEHPWALAFLPDGRMLVTEKAGRLRLVDSTGRVSPAIAGVPAVVAMGQGGLLDVAVAPDFARTRLVFLTFSERGEDGTGTAVARGRLDETATALEDVRVIFRQTPKVRSGGHYGSRIVFDRQGRLFVTLGDRFNQRDRAQDLDSGIGKVVRIDAEGRAPSDNPFVRREGALPVVWSLGHRNVQAAALDPATGELWTVEHGAGGGDELNNPRAGRNYGWPVITYGKDYSGARIGEGVSREGMEQPVYYWDPVIAPSGMTFYSGDAFPGWKGSILIGGLATKALVRLVLENGRVVREERYLGEVGERIRDVQQGPDGLVYVVTDSPQGQVLRLQPAGR